MSRFTEADFSESTTDVSSKKLKVKDDKYISIVEDEFDEYNEYSFLNRNRLSYEMTRKTKFNIFMLVYNKHLELNEITNAINLSLSKRRKYKNDEIIYYLGTRYFNNLKYDRTYVYIKFENQYETDRSKFNISINNEILIPSIRILDKNQILNVMNFIYFNDSNFPHPENINEFNEKRKIFKSHVLDVEDTSITSSITNVSQFIIKMNTIENKFNDTEHRINLTEITNNQKIDLIQNKFNETVITNNEKLNSIETKLSEIGDIKVKLSGIEHIEKKLGEITEIQLDLKRQLEIKIPQYENEIKQLRSENKLLREMNKNYEKHVTTYETILIKLAEKQMIPGGDIGKFF